MEDIEIRAQEGRWDERNPQAVEYTRIHLCVRVGGRAPRSGRGGRV